MFFIKFYKSTYRKPSETPTHHQIILKMSKKEECIFLSNESGEGSGKFTFPDGDKYEGEWKDGREWNGTGYDKNGNITGK